MLIASSARGTEVEEIGHRDVGDAAPFPCPALHELPLRLGGLAAFTAHDEQQLPPTAAARHQPLRREQVGQRPRELAALPLLRRVAQINEHGEAEYRARGAHDTGERTPRGKREPVASGAPFTYSTSGRRPARYRVTRPFTVSNTIATVLSTSTRAMRPESIITCTPGGPPRDTA